MKTSAVRKIGDFRDTTNPSYSLAAHMGSLFPASGSQQLVRWTVLNVVRETHHVVFWMPRLAIVTGELLLHTSLMGVLACSSGGGMPDLNASAISAAISNQLGQAILLPGDDLEGEAPLSIN